MMLLFSGSTAISAILPEVSAGPTLLHFIDERLKPSSWARSNSECREKAMINSKEDRYLMGFVIWFFALRSLHSRSTKAAASYIRMDTRMESVLTGWIKCSQGMVMAKSGALRNSRRHP